MGILIRKAIRTGYGVWKALFLNGRMLRERLRGKRNLSVHLSATSQLVHVEPWLRSLMARQSSQRIALFFLTPSPVVEPLKKKLSGNPLKAPVFSDLCSRFILFSDGFITIDQGAAFPYWGTGVRACFFHGQPSKGNTYRFFNYRQIDTLFFYGPLMRDLYLATQSMHPEWPRARYYEVGQPLSDERLNNRIAKDSAREQLELAPDRFTVLYAPSFEYCASLSTHGEEILNALIGMDINVIIKPHPAFYNSTAFEDEFNNDAPRDATWGKRLEAYRASPNCYFPLQSPENANVLMSAADVMLTDFSGVAFDGILFDLGMIYWDCPLFFTEYLPRRYGVNEEAAKADLASNAGRDSGIVVRSAVELVHAIETYRQNPQWKADDRRRVRETLLFNPGRASEVMADKVEEIMGLTA